MNTSYLIKILVPIFIGDNNIYFLLHVIEKNTKKNKNEWLKYLILLLLCFTIEHAKHTADGCFVKEKNVWFCGEVTITNGLFRDFSWNKLL